MAASCDLRVHRSEDATHGSHLPRADRRPEKHFVLTLRAAPGVDSIRALRWVLKILWRRFGLRCIGIEERSGR
jgi:hypothetical protein